MATIPNDPWIYHITHVNNLPGMVSEGCLWSDSERSARGIGNTNIGYSHIKQRRLQRVVELPPGGKLGDYVPFNFCQRSVMLYVVSRGHQDYDGGQDDIVHLVSRVSRVIASGRPWLFTDRHADLDYAGYFARLDDLGEVTWNVMDLTWWSDSQEIKEQRQAEFLVHEHLPWSDILCIGVHNSQTKRRVLNALEAAQHKPPVEVRRQWYYPSGR